MDLLRRRLLAGSLAGGVSLALGCGDETDGGGEPHPDEPLPPGYPIGVGDGSPGSVALVLLYDPGAGPDEATDLELHPLRPNELWVTLRARQAPQSCTQAEAEAGACAALQGKVLIGTNPGAPDASWRVTQDPNAWHFMRWPPALAMGANDTWATCGEYLTGNFTSDGVDYMGPTLFSSDPAVWTVQPPGKNGSHLDMLHESPLCAGIAWERDNAYWVFNGQIGALDRYDFKQPHEIGGEDHSDGELRRYAAGQLLRQAGVPGHLAVSPVDGWVYVADTGHGRIVKLDPLSGTVVGPPAPLFEQLALAEQIEGATFVEVVPPGTLVAPSGLHIADGVLFVTDHATSRFHAFDLDGEPLRTLQTDLPAGSLAGLTVGPDRRVYFVEKPAGRIWRIDPL